MEKMKKRKIKRNLHLISQKHIKNILENEKCFEHCDLNRIKVCLFYYNLGQKKFVAYNWDRGLSNKISSIGSRLSKKLLQSPRFHNFSKFKICKYCF
jgi:hypothetical protein